MLYYVFTFDNIYDGCSSQKEVFKTSAKAIVKVSEYSSLLKVFFKRVQRNDYHLWSNRLW